DQVDHTALVGFDTRVPEVTHVLGRRQAPRLDHMELGKYRLGNASGNELLAIARLALQQDACRGRVIPQVEQVDTPDQRRKGRVRNGYRLPQCGNSLDPLQQAFLTRNLGLQLAHTPLPLGKGLPLATQFSHCRQHLLERFQQQRRELLKPGIVSLTLNQAPVASGLLTQPQHLANTQQQRTVLSAARQQSIRYGQLIEGNLASLLADPQSLVFAWPLPGIHPAQLPVLQGIRLLAQAVLEKRRLATTCQQHRERHGQQIKQQQRRITFQARSKHQAIAFAPAPPQACSQQAE